jgi:hypothetical protein
MSQIDFFLINMAFVYKPCPEIYAIIRCINFPIQIIVRIFPNHFELENGEYVMRGEKVYIAAATPKTPCPKRTIEGNRDENEEPPAKRRLPF